MRRDSGQKNQPGGGSGEEGKRDKEAVYTAEKGIRKNIQEIARGRGCQDQGRAALKTGGKTGTSMGDFCKGKGTWGRNSGTIQPPKRSKICRATKGVPCTL